MYEDVCYDRPFLKQVIARVDFLAPNEQLRKTLPQKLANEIAKTFPISEPQETVAEELQISKDDLHRKRQEVTQWNFHGKEREKTLTITHEACFVSYSTYTTYEVLKAEFSGALQALWQTFPDTRASRLGLRYINNVELPEKDEHPTDWTDSFTEGMLGVLQFLGNPPNNLTRAFHFYEFKYDDIDLRYQFGLPNPDFPAVIKRPFFVLDLDGRVGGPQDIGEISNNIDRIHARIQDLFERSVTDHLRQIMRARPKKQQAN